MPVRFDPGPVRQSAAQGQARSLGSFRESQELDFHAKQKLRKSIILSNIQADEYSMESDSAEVFPEIETDSKNPETYVTFINAYIDYALNQYEHIGKWMVDDGIVLTRFGWYLLTVMVLGNAILWPISIYTVYSHTDSWATACVFAFVCSQPVFVVPRLFKRMLDYGKSSGHQRSEECLEVTNWLYHMRYDGVPEQEVETLKAFRCRKLKSHEEIFNDEMVEYENKMIEILNHFSGNKPKEELVKSLNKETQKVFKILLFGLIVFIFIVSDVAPNLNVTEPRVILASLLVSFCIDGGMCYLFADMFGTPYYDNSKPLWDGKKRLINALKIWTYIGIWMIFMFFYNPINIYGEPEFHTQIILSNNDERYVLRSCIAYEEEESDEEYFYRHHNFKYLHHYIFDYRDGKDRDVVLSLRGTLEWNDLLVDAWTLPLKLPGETFAVHPGFYMYAMNSYDEILQGLKDLGCYSPLGDLLDCNVVFTGHSLGGSVANVLAYMFMKNGYEVSKVISFGAPSQFAVFSFDEQHNKHVTSPIIEKLKKISRNYRVSSDAVVWQLGDRQMSFNHLQRAHTETMAYMASLGFDSEMQLAYGEHYDAFDKWSIYTIQSSWPKDVYEWDHHGCHAYMWGLEHLADKERNLKSEEKEVKKCRWHECEGIASYNYIQLLIVYKKSVVVLCVLSILGMCFARRIQAKVLSILAETNEEKED